MLRGTGPLPRTRPYPLASVTAEEALSTRESSRPLRHPRPPNDSFVARLKLFEVAHPGCVITVSGVNRGEIAWVGAVRAGGICTVGRGR
jgi:hypothetical protein